MNNFQGWRISRAVVVAIIVTIGLFLALYAGMVFVQQRGEQVRQDEAAEIARQNLEEDSQVPEVIAEESPAPEAQEESEQPPVPTDPALEVLPETGPSPWMIVPVAALVYVGTLFVMSRKDVAL